MWLMAGYGTSGVDLVYHNDVVFSADGVTWVTYTQHAPWPGRCMAGATAANGRLWLAGGQSGYQRLVRCCEAGRGWPARCLVQLCWAWWPSRSGTHVCAGSGAAQLSDLWSSADGVEWVLVASGTDASSCVPAQRGAMFIAAPPSWAGAQSTLAVVSAGGSTGPASGASPPVVSAGVSTLVDTAACLTNGTTCNRQVRRKAVRRCSRALVL